MTWDYSPEDLVGNPVNAVHFYLGDTVSTDQLIQDEEIEFLIAQWAPVYGEGQVILFASKAAEYLAAKFAREVSYSADGVSIGTQELQSKYQALAAQLREQAQGASFVEGPYVGGVLEWEQPDPSIKPPAFGIGMHDNIQAGTQNIAVPNYAPIPEIDGGY